MLSQTVLHLFYGVILVENIHTMIFEEVQVSFKLVLTFLRYKSVIILAQNLYQYMAQL